MPSPYPLHYTDDALDDLDAIADWYAEQQAWDAAFDVPDRIRDEIPLIAHQPKGWAIGLSGHPERVLQDLPYRVIYDFDGAQVHILRIKHFTQKWPE